jgi:hypothetical protein
MMAPITADHCRPILLSIGDNPVLVSAVWCASENRADADLMLELKATSKSARIMYLLDIDIATTDLVNRILISIIEVEDLPGLEVQHRVGVRHGPRFDSTDSGHDNSIRIRFPQST